MERGVQRTPYILLYGAYSGGWLYTEYLLRSSSRLGDLGPLH